MKAELGAVPASFAADCALSCELMMLLLPASDFLDAVETADWQHRIAVVLGLTPAT